VNAVGLSLLHSDREHHLSTRGAYLHILGDLLGSVGALIAAVIVLTTGWTLADPIISVLIAVLILGGAWRLVRESTDILLEAVPGHVSMPEVQRRMLAVPRRLRGPRPPRVDGHERYRGHERTRGGARTRRSSRRLEPDSRGDG
jgi:cation diffusion facilitator family transporter